MGGGNIGRLGVCGGKFGFGIGRLCAPELGGILIDVLIGLGVIGDLTDTGERWLGLALGVTFLF
jgi:hypothetical protein